MIGPRTRSDEMERQKKYY